MFMDSLLAFWPGLQVGKQTDRQTDTDRHTDRHRQTEESLSLSYRYCGVT